VLRFRAMRRAQAILVLLALFSAPLALLARGEACAEACSKFCCVALHHSSHSDSAGAGHCHGNPQSTRCCDEAAPNHALDFGFTILLPLTIIPSAASLGAPAISGTAITSAAIFVSSRYTPPPFEPPRA